MKGWYFQRYRHSLAARGISTNPRISSKINFVDKRMPDWVGKKEIRHSYLPIGFKRKIGVDWVDEIIGDVDEDNFEENGTHFSFIEASPEAILLFLEERGVNTENVPDFFINSYADGYDSGKDMMVPYAIMEGDDILDSGNVAQLRAADLLDLPSVPFLVVRE